MHKIQFSKFIQKTSKVQEDRKGEKTGQTRQLNPKSDETHLVLRATINVVLEKHALKIQDCYLNEIQLYSLIVFADRGEPRISMNVWQSFCFFLIFALTYQAGHFFFLMLP